MKRSPLASVKRTIRRGATWRPKQSGQEQLDILKLASPLRYDVLVRAQFFDWLAANAAGCSDAEVVAGARELPYRVWFTQIAMARFRPWVLKEPDLLEEQFSQRVTSARRLAESISEHTFDPAHPVTLRRSIDHPIADTGATIAKTLHIGDGGHRLAILLTQGATLEPWMYRVDPRPMPVLDNTAVLSRALRLDEETYASFIGREFVDNSVCSTGELRDSVLRTAPGRLAELDSVLTAHGRMPVDESGHLLTGGGSSE